MSAEDQTPANETATWSEGQNDHSAAIVVDPDLSSQSGDSAYGDEASNYTASLTSSITNYRYENGRRYHAYREGAYIFPNDEQENDRLDIFNHLLALVLDGRLFLAPIGDNPQRILDLGTGTGIWAIDVGDMFPSAEVIGIDLSPIQPSMVPPNVRFIVDDMEDEWTYDAPFDFIHARYLTNSIGDWPQLVRRIFQNTKPGGWAEMQDLNIAAQCDDGSLKREDAVARVFDLLIEAGDKIGRIGTPGPKLAGWLADAGFRNVQHQVFKLPLGTWPKDKKLKEMGIWNQLQLTQGVESFTYGPLNRVLGWSMEEVEVLLAAYRKDLKDSSKHVYFNFHVAYGQRPADQ